MNVRIPIAAAVATASLAVAVPSIQGAQSSPSLASATKDGCTVTVTEPVLTPLPRAEAGIADMSVECNRRHLHGRLSIPVQKFVPTVWIGSTANRALAIPAHRAISFRGGEVCVPGGSTRFRASATVTFPDRGRTVTIRTPFATTTLDCL